MNIGVVGVGTMGKNHVRIYSELKDVEKVFIHDVNSDAAVKAAEKYEKGVIVCDSVDSLLDNVDAVSICTSTKDHFSTARKAIEKGINCLIEKPVSLTSQEGEELLKSLKNDVIVGVGHIERFNPVMREIKGLLKRPRYIEVKRHNPASLRIVDADVVLDLMIHDIDLIWNYLMNGDSYRIYTFWDDDLCKVIARFNDCTVSISASRLACRKIRNIYIEDEDFSIDGDFMTHDVYIYRKPQKYGEADSRYMQENIISKVLVNKVEPLKEELKTFIGCVQEGRPFPVTVGQAVENLRIVEEIKKRGKKTPDGGY
ncbi:MAG: gfo/Idh/MocA family oxidoreductase [Peptococcaceae bacterium]|nr:MAG: gfo/Idh/MocA family oxidoreductase [Peptococcaceae bacterium]